jgi:protein-L-isoaspartate O-methyltransferase
MKKYYSLKSPLRPDYASYFPTFNADELEKRNRNYPPHLTTQLSPKNIANYCRVFGNSWWHRYLGLSTDQKSAMLRDVLRACGTSSDTIEAFAVVPRHLFVAEKYRDLAYLNWSIPIARGSCLSAPGIVSIMCDEIARTASGTALEVGAGSGYHASILAARCPNLEVVGYEACIPVAEFGQELVTKHRLERVVIIPAAVCENTSVGELAVAYHTAAHDDGPLGTICQSLVDEGRYLFVRPLTRQEYMKGPIDTWLHGMFSTFDSYLAAGSSRVCVLVSAVKRYERLIESRRLYGVTFVDWREDADQHFEEIDNHGIEDLLTAVAQS